MGLLSEFRDTHNDNINTLFRSALEHIAFMPFGLLIDLYRYDLFSGNVTEEKWNYHWEHLREKYQKIRSPTKRTEEHFDAGAKFHVAADRPYISYFIARTLQFQLYRALCRAAGQYEPGDPTKPFHKCDFGESKEAGRLFRAGLSLGNSKHWSKVLSVITNGETELTADAMVEYFKPLHMFLKVENENARKFYTSR